MFGGPIWILGITCSLGVLIWPMFQVTWKVASLEGSQPLVDIGL